MGKAPMIAAALICSLLIFHLRLGLAAEPANYCRDKASWKIWDAFVAEHFRDDDVQALHALRLGLCVKIEGGSVPLDRAVAIFERAHARLVEKWQKDVLRSPKEHKIQ